MPRRRRPTTTQRVPSARTSTSSARTSAPAPRPNQRTETPCSAAIGAIAATRGSSALSTATPPGRRARTSSDFACERRLDAAESSGVGHADHEHDAHVGLDEPREARDLTGRAGTELAHQEPRALAHPQHRQRSADLVVERGARRDRLALVLQDAGEHVLGRRLAVRAGDPDDAQVDRHPARSPRRGGRDRRGRRSHRRTTTCVTAAATTRSTIATVAPFATAASTNRCPSVTSPGLATKMPPGSMSRESVSTPPETIVSGESPGARWSRPPRTWAS